MTAARKRAEAMARAAMDTASDDDAEAASHAAAMITAMLDAYFAHTWFVEEQELRAGFKKRPVRLYPKPEPIE